MSVAIENITEEYGSDGASVYSLVKNMEFYDAKVSGGDEITISKRDGRELGNTDAEYYELYNEMVDFLNEEASNI